MDVITENLPAEVNKKASNALFTIEVKHHYSKVEEWVALTLKEILEKRFQDHASIKQSSSLQEDVKNNLSKILVLCKNIVIQLDRKTVLSQSISSSFFERTMKLCEGMANYMASSFYIGNSYNFYLKTNLPNEIKSQILYRLDLITKKALLQIDDENLTTKEDNLFAQLHGSLIALLKLLKSNTGLASRIKDNILNNFLSGQSAILSQLDKDYLVINKNTLLFIQSDLNLSALDKDQLLEELCSEKKRQELFKLYKANRSLKEDAFFQELKSEFNNLFKLVGIDSLPPAKAVKTIEILLAIIKSTSIKPICLADRASSESALTNTQLSSFQFHS